MKTKDRQAFHAKTLQELKRELVQAKETLFLLKLDKSLGKLKNIRSIFWKRKEIAQISTIIRGKELSLGIAPELTPGSPHSDPEDL